MKIKKWSRLNASTVDRIELFYVSSKCIANYFTIKRIKMIFYRNTQKIRKSSNDTNTITLLYVESKLITNDFIIELDRKLFSS